MSRPAYLDDKNIRWDTNDADLEGIMSKKSKWWGEWRERYFILKGPKIFFTKSSTEAPHGMISLVDCLSVEKLAAESGKAHIFEMIMRDGEKFVLSAKTKEVKDNWVKEVSRQILISTSAFFEDFDD
jgi:hypothetical protein